VGWNDFKKSAAVRLLDWSGVALLLRPFCGGRGAILALHRVVPEGVPVFEPGNAVRVEHLRQVLQYVQRHGWDFVSLNEIPARLQSSRPSKRRFLAITLDDGYLDNLLYGLPLFEQFRAPFTVFPAVGFINRTVPYWPVVADALLAKADRIAIEEPDRGTVEYRCATPEEKLAVFERIALPWTDPAVARRLTAVCSAARRSIVQILDEAFLSWDQLQSLSRHPLATVGVHTLTHAALARLPEDEAAHEMSAAKAELESRIGRKVAHIAYPYGSPGECGDREFRLAREIGFATGCTTTRGNLLPRHRDRLWSLPRHTLSMVRHGANTAYLRLSLAGVWNTPLPRILGR